MKTDYTNSCIYQNNLNCTYQNLFNFTDRQNIKQVTCITYLKINLTAFKCRINYQNKYQSEKENN